MEVELKCGKCVGKRVEIYIYIYIVSIKPMDLDIIIMPLQQWQDGWMAANG